ncbi:MAG: hypothetical protein HY276_09625 [Ignavibacteriales bacterium]|nr:hypothetical protein [Ignavibacteriales bacterium]MBI3788497.1 hypothetical protein [Ignavibacteriales bacterium]
MKERSLAFLNNLYEEKLKHKEHRMNYVVKKILFTVGLFGLGSSQIPPINLTPFLYLIPFVALACDLFIFAEDFKVKRIGIFVQKYCSFSCPDEKNWERLVNDYREPLAVFASFILSLIVLFASIFAVFATKPDRKFFVYWYLLSIAATLFSFYYAWAAQKKLKKALSANLEKRST